MKTETKKTYKPLTESEVKLAQEIYSNVSQSELEFLLSDDNRNNKGELIKYKFERTLKVDDESRQVDTREWRMLKSHVENLLRDKLSIEGEVLENAIAEFRLHFADKLGANSLTGKVYNYFTQKDSLNMLVKAITTKLKTGSVTIEIDGIKYKAPKFDDRENACYINKADNTSHRPNILNWSNITEKVTEG